MNDQSLQALNFLQILLEREYELQNILEQSTLQFFNLKTPLTNIGSILGRFRGLMIEFNSKKDMFILQYSEDNYETISLDELKDLLKSMSKCTEVNLDAFKIDLKIIEREKEKMQNGHQNLKNLEIRIASSKFTEKDMADLDFRLQKNEIDEVGKESQKEFLKEEIERLEKQMQQIDKEMGEFEEKNNFNNKEIEKNNYVSEKNEETKFEEENMAFDIKRKDLDVYYQARIQQFRLKLTESEAAIANLTIQKKYYPSELEKQKKIESDLQKQKKNFEIWRNQEKIEIENWEKARQELNIQEKIHFNGQKQREQAYDATLSRTFALAQAKKEQEVNEYISNLKKQNEVLIQEKNSVFQQIEKLKTALIALDSSKDLVLDARKNKIQMENIIKEQLKKAQESRNLILKEFDCSNEIEFSQKVEKLEDLFVICDKEIFRTFEITIPFLKDLKCELERNIDFNGDGYLKENGEKFKKLELF